MSKILRLTFFLGFLIPFKGIISEKSDILSTESPVLPSPVIWQSCEGKCILFEKPNASDQESLKDRLRLESIQRKPYRLQFSGYAKGKGWDIFLKNEDQGIVSTLSLGEFSPEMNCRYHSFTLSQKSKIGYKTRIVVWDETEQRQVNLSLKRKYYKNIYQVHLAYQKDEKGAVIIFSLDLQSTPKIIDGFLLKLETIAPDLQNVQLRTMHLKTRREEFLSLSLKR